MADFEGRGHSKMQGAGMGPGEVHGLMFGSFAD